MDAVQSAPRQWLPQLACELTGAGGQDRDGQAHHGGREPPLRRRPPYARRNRDGDQQDPARNPVPPTRSATPAPRMMKDPPLVDLSGQPGEDRQSGEVTGENRPGPPPGQTLQLLDRPPASEEQGGHKRGGP